MRRLLALATWLHLAVVLVVWALLRLAGESWWVAMVVLYAPRLPLLLPSLVLVPALLLRRRRGLLLTQVAVALAVLFPIAGLQLPHTPPVSPTAGPVIRVLSWNVHFGRDPGESMVDRIRAAAPDLVLLQATSDEVDKEMRSGFGDWHLHTAPGLLLASRFRIESCAEPPAISAAGGVQPTPAGFFRCTLITPLGPIDVFNAHPPSPRGALEELREGSRAAPMALAREGDALRAQIHALAGEARASRLPVLIAGDLNLAGGSRIFADELGYLRDGFVESGRWFGFTFPANARHRWLPPYLRIDRVLGDHSLAFAGFQVGSSPNSDHRFVVAEVTRAN